MIRRETYEWMEPILEEAEREGARVISVSHHNLLDESGVSRAFYDNCTIEHNEELVRMLSDHGVRLHLSGHLHIQHYKEDEDTGIYEIVTGSMDMAPCHYGIVRSGTTGPTSMMRNLSMWTAGRYATRTTTEIWQILSAYSESILRRAAIRDAIRDLNRHIEDRHAFFTDEKKQEMASYYADLCVNYYEGRDVPDRGSRKGKSSAGRLEQDRLCQRTERFSAEYPGGRGEGLRASEDSERTLNKNGGTRRHGRDKKTAFAADNALLH